MVRLVQKQTEVGPPLKIHRHCFGVTSSKASGKQKWGKTFGENLERNLEYWAKITFGNESILSVDVLRSSVICIIFLTLFVIRSVN